MKKNGGATLVKISHLVATVILFFFSVLALNGQDKIQIDAQGKGEVFDHYWSKCVGAGRANEALRAGWLEQLETTRIR